MSVSVYEARDYGEGGEGVEGEVWEGAFRGDGDELGVEGIHGRGCEEWGEECGGGCAGVEG